MRRVLLTATFLRFAAQRQKENGKDIHTTCEISVEGFTFAKIE